MVSTGGDGRAMDVWSGHADKVIAFELLYIVDGYAEHDHIRGR